MVQINSTNMKTIRIIALFACIAICIPFYAQTELEKKAIKGDVKAQSELADLYLEKGDYENAFKWAEMAAEKGFAEAQNTLGELYLYWKEGDDDDKKKAFKLFLKASKQGHAEAQLNLGVCYDFGYGCPSNDKKAFKWKMKAAQQGNDRAQNSIGYCYYFGNGCKQNYYLAFEWWMRAAQQGHSYAQCKLGECYYEGEGCAQNYAKAFEWYMKAAEQGNEEAMKKIAICYLLGEGITANEGKAFYWAEKGENNTMLGFLYYYGIGTTVDYSKAFQHVLRGAENGNAQAQAMLGHFYTNGIGCEVNSTKAAEWNAKAKENGGTQRNEINYKGNSYKIISPTEVKLFSINSSSTDVTIPPIIVSDRGILGSDYYAVTEIPSWSFRENKRIINIAIPNTIKKIEEDAFRNFSSLQNVALPNNLVSIGKSAFQECKSLRNIIIPNSVTFIGETAFWGCEKLETIIVPDECSIEKWWGSTGKSTAFLGCHNLKSVKGHNIMYPKWIVEHLSFEDDNSMYEWAKDVPKNSYNYYAYDRIVELMTEWQQKKEYETTAQWQARVTEATRAEHLKKVQKQVLAEFIEKKKPATLEGNIGSYDADYGVFPITTDDLGTFYLEVPMENASKVKEQWSQAKVLPTYGIADDKLAIASAEVSVNGKTYKTADRYENTATDIAINLPPLQIDLGNGNTEHTKPDVAQAIDRSIDQNIPVVTNNNDRTFAVIIGNENYKEVAKVPHALNDAKVFAAYCEKTLGLPQKNIKQYADATFGTMLSAIENVQSIAKAYKGDINVILYYAGHGIPDESSNEAYLLPVDANGRNTAACYPIDKLYGELKALGANQVTVFLDACFSGAQRGNGMLASARGVAIKAKQAAPQGNMVVFSAASADETAYPYNEKGHGLFTYYLLKKLNETKGDVTLGELGSYICEKVAQESVVSNGKSQTPTVVPSVSIVDNWKNLKLTK